MQSASLIVRILVFLLPILAAGGPAQPDPITLFMIGDSTMSDKEVEAYPETGWGMPFKYYFDEQ